MDDQHLPVKAIQNEVERAFKRQDVTVRGMGLDYSPGTVSSVPMVTQIEEVVMNPLVANLADLGVQPNVINLLEVKTRQRVQLDKICRG